jgi:DNA-binding transcriptional ArsR family regulator
MTARNDSPRTKTKSRRPRDDATKMAKALAHPLRSAILVELNKRTASPGELSRDLGVPLTNLSYHIRVLIELDCIELVDTQPRRGAIEHFYRAVQRAEASDKTWAEMSPAARRRLSSEWYRAAFTDASHALETGQLDRPDIHLSWTQIELDHEGWEEIADGMRDLVERALELQASATDGQRGRLLMALYEPPRTSPVRRDRS